MQDVWQFGSFRWRGAVTTIPGLEIIAQSTGMWFARRAHTWKCEEIYQELLIIHPEALKDISSCSPNYAVRSQNALWFTSCVNKPRGYGSS